MRARLTVALMLLALSQLGAPCTPPTRIVIEEPPKRVETFSFDVRVVLQGAIDSSSLRIELNGEPILDRFTGGPEIFEATIVAGFPLRDNNVLKARANRTGKNDSRNTDCISLR